MWRKRPGWAPVGSLALIYDAAIEDGEVHPGLLDRFRPNGKDIVGKYYQVRQFAGLNGTFDRLLMFCERRANGVRMHRLRHRDALFGDPAMRVFSIERAPRDGRI